MTIPAFEDRPPASPRLTSYDERHLITYLRLLDAEEEGAHWTEVVKVIFGIDPDKEPERAATIHATHLMRAQWMVDNGYRHLLKPRLQ